MKLLKPLAILAFAMLPSTLLACDTDAGEAPLFSCITGKQGKYIEICAKEEEPGERWSTVQYRFGKPGEKPELAYPANPAEGGKRLLFSHRVDKGIYKVSIRFVSGGYTYRVYSESKGEMEGSAGVTASDAKGKRIAAIDCAERPEIYPGYLPRALACDMENPFGKAGCAEPAPKQR